jgi:hypothetical protein
MPPVTVPTVQVKVLGTELVKLIFGPVPSHVEVLFGVVTIGEGLTVIVIEYGVPGHEPVVAVGVIMY